MSPQELVLLVHSRASERQLGWHDRRAVAPLTAPARRGTLRPSMMDDPLALSVTEQENPRSRDIASMSIADAVALINDEDARVAEAVQQDAAGRRSRDRRHRRAAREGRPPDSRRHRDVGAPRRARRLRVSADVRRDAGAGAGPDRRRLRRVPPGGGSVGRRSRGRRPRSRRPRRRRARRRRRHRRVRTDAVHDRRGRTGPRARRVHGRRHLRARFRDHARGRRRDRAGGRPGGARRLEPHEGRHRAEDGAQHAVDGDDDPAGLRHRQPHDQHAGAQQQAARALDPHHPRRDRRRRRRPPRRRWSGRPATCRRRSSC